MSIPVSTADDKLREIQQMLESGQQSVWLERHTLIIWGITIGLLDLLAGPLTKPWYQSNFWYGLGMEFLIIGLALGAAIYSDFRLTRALRNKRDETITLVQKRITIVIWMIFLFAFLLSMFAAVKLGGGLRVMAMQLLLAGIVLITLGQFSQRWYTWSGAVMLVYGVYTAFRFQPGVDLRIHVSTAFIVGCLFCAFALSRATNYRNMILLAMTQFVLMLGIASGLSQVYHTIRIKPDRWPVLTLKQYMQSGSAGKQIVVLPAGTRIPVRFRIGADIFSAPANLSATFKTRREIRLVVENDKPVGIYSLDGKNWMQARGNVHISRFVRKTELSRGTGPAIYREIWLRTRRNTHIGKESK